MVISYRCLHVPDVTVDGSSVFAAAICAVLMKKMGVDMPVAIIFAIAGGFVAGLITGAFVEILRINSLLAGILNAFILYSLALVLVDASLDFDSKSTLFSWFKEQDLLFSQRLPKELVLHPFVLSLLLGLAAILKIGVDWFLKREWGVALRGAGSNELVLQLRGTNTRKMRILGFGIANALVGFGGTLISMYEGSVQVMRWPGTIIFALSVAIVGWEASRHLLRVFNVKLSESSAIILGALLYYVIVRACYTFNAPASLPRLIIALYIVLVLAEKQGLRRRVLESFR